VTAVPAKTPRFPAIRVIPVLVTVEPASTAKLCAVPRVSASCADATSSEGFVWERSHARGSVATGITRIASHRSDRAVARRTGAFFVIGFILYVA
jgi:hypothetical protein